MMSSKYTFCFHWFDWETSSGRNDILCIQVSAMMIKMSEDFLEIEYISESLPCWHIPVMCENTTETLETENNPRCPTSNAVFIKSWLLGFPKKKKKVQSLTLETSIVNFGPVLYTPQKPCLGIADAKWTHLTSAHDSKCTFITPKTVK